VSAAGVSVVIPPGALPEDAQITLTPLQTVTGGAGNLPAAPAGATVVAIFSIEAVAADDGQPITQLNAPVTLNVTVTPEALAAAGGNAGAISVQFVNSAGAWQAVSCSVSGSTLSCSTDHFSLWGLIATSAGQATPTATTPGATGTMPPGGTSPRPPATGMGVTEDDGSFNLGLALAALGAVIAAGAAGGLAARRALARQR
jgi:hypothetical protein